MSAALIGETPWDQFDSYLFDIDGTLIHCTDAVHYFAFCEALQTISNLPLTLEGVVAHGNTDVGILRDAFGLAGVADHAWRPRLSEIRDAMCSFVKAHESELCVTVLPSVQNVLEHLRSKGALLGIATGNLKEIGRAKLNRAGLLNYFEIGGWSDKFEYRSDVFRSALKQVQELIPAGTKICAIGDTPADVLAARSNGIPVVAVATGVYSRGELMEHGPDLCLQSFEDLFAP